MAEIDEKGHIQIKEMPRPPSKEQEGLTMRQRRKLERRRAKNVKQEDVPKLGLPVPLMVGSRGRRTRIK